VSKRRRIVRSEGILIGSSDRCIISTRSLNSRYSIIRNRRRAVMIN
jgi:hypothetical protein